MERGTPKRCSWAEGCEDIYVDYHDNEWGVPLHDDTRLFELLILEGFQAGLSWITILKKRENFRRAFEDFDPEKIASYDRKKIDSLLSNSGIIRNRSKIEASIQNAKSFIRVKEEFGSFDRYIWRFVGGRTRINSWREWKEIPTTSRESNSMSMDMKSRGFKYVGPTICYSFMQAAGLVNDHEVECFRYEEIIKKFCQNIT